MTDGHYPTYRELLTKVRWENYGVVDGVARDSRCENCMVHCGYDPSGALGTNYQRGDNWKNFAYNFGRKPRPHPASAELEQRAYNGFSIGKGHLAEAKAAVNREIDSVPAGLAGAKSAFARGGNGTAAGADMIASIDVCNEAGARLFSDADWEYPIKEYIWYTFF